VLSNILFVTDTFKSYIIYIYKVFNKVIIYL